MCLPEGWASLPCTVELNPSVQRCDAHLLVVVAEHRMDVLVVIVALITLCKMICPIVQRRDAHLRVVVAEHRKDELGGLPQIKLVVVAEHRNVFR